MEEPSPGTGLDIHFNVFGERIENLLHPELAFLLNKSSFNQKLESDPPVLRCLSLLMLFWVAQAMNVVDQSSTHPFYWHEYPLHEHNMATQIRTSVTRTLTV